MQESFKLATGQLLNVKTSSFKGKVHLCCIDSRQYTKNGNSLLRPSFSLQIKIHMGSNQFSIKEIIFLTQFNLFLAL